MFTASAGRTSGMFLLSLVAPAVSVRTRHLDSLVSALTRVTPNHPRTVLTRGSGSLCHYDVAKGCSSALE